MEQIRNDFFKVIDPYLEEIYKIVNMIDSFQPKEKEFKCKGNRHQYSKVIKGNNVDWICTCGKILS